jgi:hypothetical protein
MAPNPNFHEKKCNDVLGMSIDKNERLPIPVRRGENSGEYGDSQQNAYQAYYPPKKSRVDDNQPTHNDE